MKAAIVETIDEAAGIRSFVLEPEKKWQFSPGQWMYVEVEPQERHQFSISAAPGDEYLQFTTKYRPESEYKNKLWKKSAGDTLEIVGPQGSFVMAENDTTKKLLVAGGIGITPFRSMIKNWKNTRLSTSVVLLYSGSSYKEMAFTEELSYWGMEVENLEVEFIETSERGRISPQMVTELCPDYRKRSWWVCGSQSMVVAMIEMAQGMGVDSANIKSEDFPGY